LCATSVGDCALFAGGRTESVFSNAVDLFETPEPATLLLLGTGALGILRLRRRGKVLGKVLSSGV
jgi:hypothetical protein